MLLSVLNFVFKWGIILSIVVFLIQYWLVKKSYILSDREVAKIAEKYVGREPAEAFDLIHEEFSEKFYGHILPEGDTQWIFMNCGGWMGSMKILHASITEYLLFFGTAVDTSGNSGRYWANISDTILTGSFRQWKEGEINSTVFKPGDTVYHYVGEAAAVQWSAGTWMVEYGRGFIPSTLGFALADTFFSTQDFVNLFYILRVYTKSLANELSFWLYWQLATFTELPPDQ